MSITIFRAKSLVTLDSAVTQADAVAVQDGRVLHTGSFAQVMDDLARRDLTVNDQFADSVIVPGFIEAHCHILSEGALTRFPWVGSYPRRRVDGTFQQGCPTIDAVVQRLNEAHVALADPNEVLVAVGFDASMIGSAQITLSMLNSVSETRPIWVMQSNGHVGHANSAMLARAGVDDSISEEGIHRDASGQITGEIRELSLSRFLGKHVRLDVGGESTAWDAGRLSQQVGCTMVTDLATTSSVQELESFAAIVNGATYPVRVRFAPLVSYWARKKSPEELLSVLSDLKGKNTDKFALGPLKFMTDGSIQGRTARLMWPGYCCGSPNGLWLGKFDEMFDQMLPLHQAGYQIAMHTNGDEAIQFGLDLYERLLEATPRPDHRHRLEHVQMASEAMFRRMKLLGVLPNLFANHLYYWGDTHRHDTMGPAKARHLDAAGTAERLGIPYSIHSDAPVTPLDPLFTMWCAVNRVTSSGYVLGEAERITADQALRAMTLGSAFLLGCDQEYGSIEVGKHADFAILDADPRTVDPMEIKDISVHATVLGGMVNTN